MPEEMLCSFSHVAVKGKQNMLLEDFSLSIERKQIIALISEDESAELVLKLMAGLCVPDSGKILYPSMTKQERTRFPKKIQYVPDDLVCYPGLRVNEFLYGMSNGNEEFEANAARLLSVFEIEEKELLLDMTFGQNRLVSVIQAMMAEPALLLLNNPCSMLNKKTYRLLLKEIVKLYANETTVVFAAKRYEDVVLPCRRYLFFEDGKIRAACTRSQLPRPAKVITMWGGDLSRLQSEKMQMLVKGQRYFRFLYRERNMKELASQLSRSGCDNFNIEELSMEEELFGDYERWLQ